MWGALQGAHKLYVYVVFSPSTCTAEDLWQPVFLSLSPNLWAPCKAPLALDIGGTHIQRAYHRAEKQQLCSERVSHLGAARGGC